ncbi:MAG: hypothetical protein V2I97_15985 [Desulfococcaceae bacterium]|jgi:hypothetical protein|nr:hypothetical protein [Desulfococcaceae bacterium]
MNRNKMLQEAELTLKNAELTTKQFAQKMRQTSDIKQKKHMALALAKLLDGCAKYSRELRRRRDPRQMRNARNAGSQDAPAELYGDPSYIDSLSE